MRMIVAALLLAGAAVTTNTSAARADSITYPWCAQYAADEGGTSNCGFATLEQCRAALSGNGGFCIENPMYRATTGVTTPPARRPQR